jgi:hypothetical protein
MGIAGPSYPCGVLCLPARLAYSLSPKRPCFGIESSLTCFGSRAHYTQRFKLPRNANTANPVRPATRQPECPFANNRHQDQQLPETASLPPHEESPSPLLRRPCH